MNLYKSAESASGKHFDTAQDKVMSGEDEEEDLISGLVSCKLGGPLYRKGEHSEGNFVLIEQRINMFQRPLLSPNKRDNTSKTSRTNRVDRGLATHITSLKQHYCEGYPGPNLCRMVYREEGESDEHVGCESECYETSERKRSE